MCNVAFKNKKMESTSHFFEEQRKSKSRGYIDMYLHVCIVCFIYKIKIFQVEVLQD